MSELTVVCTECSIVFMTWKRQGFSTQDLNDLVNNSRCGCGSSHVVAMINGEKVAETTIYEDLGGGSSDGEDPL